MSLELDDETREMLAVGSPWPETMFELFHRREISLSVKRADATSGRTPKRKQAPCPGCGKAFNQRLNGWLRSYCSDSCRVAHHRNRDRAQSVARFAERPTKCACGKPLVQRREFKVRKFCSRKCQRRTA